jgi:hypothetical protein
MFSVNVDKLTGMTVIVIQWMQLLKNVIKIIE